MRWGEVEERASAGLHARERLEEEECWSNGRVVAGILPGPWRVRVAPRRVMKVECCLSVVGVIESYRDVSCYTCRAVLMRGSFIDSRLEVLQAGERKSK